MIQQTFMGERDPYLPSASDLPHHIVDWEPYPRWVRAKLGGETVVDSKSVMLLRETDHLPVYYFPMADINMDFLARTDHTTHCRYKGDAIYWTVTAGGKVSENAVWSYPNPLPKQEHIRDYMAFYWDKMDAWYEEDEEVFVHPRDPYKRVDVLPSTRHVRVVIADKLIAETRRPYLLFETNLPTRYYIHPDDIDMDLLQLSDNQSRCPYKGLASHWSVVVDDKEFSDIAWSYADPISECSKIKGLISFYNEQVDLYVDGELQPRPKTPWSSSAR